VAAPAIVNQGGKWGAKIFSGGPTIKCLWNRCPPFRSVWVFDHDVCMRILPHFPFATCLETSALENRGLGVSSPENFLIYRLLIVSFNEFLHITLDRKWSQFACHFHSMPQNINAKCWVIGVFLPEFFLNHRLLVVSFGEFWNIKFSLKFYIFNNKNDVNIFFCLAFLCTVHFRSLGSLGLSNSPILFETSLC